MKIAYVNIVGLLGWHRILYKQCRGLAEHGFDVDFYTLAETEQVIYGVKIKPIQKKNRRIFRFLQGFSLFRKLRCNHYDIITVVNPELLPLAIFLKIFSQSRVVFDCYEAWADFIKHKTYLGKSAKFILPPFIRFALSLSSRLLDGFIFSDENISQDFPNLPKDRQICFHNFPWLAMFPDKIKPWTQREYDVVYPGTLSRTGGLFIMLEAINSLKQKITTVKCLFIGEIPPAMQKDVDKFIVENNLDNNITFAGLLPYNEVPALMQNAKVGLVGLLDLPKFHKNIAGKIFDYMACGIPIVSVDLPPERPYITSGVNGYLIPPENPQAMADAIYKILSNPEVGKNMAVNSRENLLKNHYYAEKETDSLVDLYHYIFKHKKGLFRTN